MKANLKRKLIGVVLILCCALTGCSTRESRDDSDWNYEKGEIFDDSDWDKDAEETSDDSEWDDSDWDDSDWLDEVEDKDNENRGMISGIINDTVSAIKKTYLEDAMEELIHDITEDSINNMKDLNEFKGNWGTYKKSTKDELTIKDVKAKSFQIDINMGNVKVGYGTNDTAIVKAKYTTYGNKKDEIDKILQAVDIDYSMKNDKLQILFVDKNTKKNIWNVVYDKYKNQNLSVDLDITLPESVNNFDIDNKLGYIGLNSVKGAFDINAALGNIDLKDITFIGKSEIKADMGKIDCSLSKDIKEKSKVKMDNSLGNIRIDMNSLSYKGGKKDRSYGYKRGIDSRKIVIGNLCEMDLYVDMGEISIK
jgi:hypothetical protein